MPIANYFFIVSQPVHNIGSVASDRGYFAVRFLLVNNNRRFAAPSFDYGGTYLAKLARVVRFLA